MISLHTDILTHLREVVPFAEREHQPKPARGHTRWYSVDTALPTRKTFNSVRHGRLSLNLNRSSDEDSALELLCDPRVMAAVAGVFSARIALLSVYEQFGGYYELMRVDIEQTQQAIASW